MKKKFIKLLVVLILVFIVVISIFICKYFTKVIFIPEKIQVVLDKCIDGDTVWLRTDGVSKKYRLLAIDTPEVDEYYGFESTNYTCSLLMGAKVIEVEYDRLSDRQDKYNRELVWVYIDGELLQNKILYNGFGEVKYIYHNYDYLDSLYDSENYAKDNKIGIWSIN